MKNTPLFLRFLNRETSVLDILSSFSKVEEKTTAEAAKAALDNPPDIEEFRKELEEAVRDLIKEGLGDEFKAFVNHYMESSLEEDIHIENGSFGENRSQTARVKNPSGPWVQGFICYNLCLYIKAFGLEELKTCKVCGKIFNHKGKWAAYCSDLCKSNKKQSDRKQD